ncbi:MAG: FAD-binding protein, partial [Acidobacteria bacterium]
MTETEVGVDGVSYPVRSANTLIVGSGAAALNAAVWLHDLGVADLVIATEVMGGGASANSGSDKQTYYKLSIAGDQADSPRQMAEDLAAGGCMHGDIALCEAQHSAQAFYRLVQFGVPFPHDSYGAFVGYKTDHDPRGRATSAGPLTSRLMFDALAREVRARQVPVLDGHQVVALLVDRRAEEPRIAGAMALARGDREEAPRFVLFNVVNVVLATGGPGGLYADSVYPEEQTGSIGLALVAGAMAQNLTESQYGLASTALRWNVSGSYQQAIPRYVSTAQDGSDEHDFLYDAFPGPATLANATFRKGYEWPFDPRLVDRFGSSLIDLLVYRERIERGRRVFLDYTRNPGGAGDLGAFSLEVLDPEARHYLENCGATGATPIERLCQMNMPAVDFCRGRGNDLASQRLEVSVCAQHNNGGLTGNRWWESNVRGLFSVGAVSVSQRVTRRDGAEHKAE